jgi:hypothetical protein
MIDSWDEDINFEIMLFRVHHKKKIMNEDFENFFMGFEPKLH